MRCGRAGAARWRVAPHRHSRWRHACLRSGSMSGVSAARVVEVRPGEGIGPVSLGMSREDALSAMRRVDSRSQEQVYPMFPVPRLAMFDSAFVVTLTLDEKVNGIEVWGAAGEDQRDLARSPRDIREIVACDVTLAGLSLLCTPVRDLEDLVTATAEDGSPSLRLVGGVLLWRDDEDLEYFEQVTLSA